MMFRANDIADYADGTNYANAVYGDKISLIKSYIENNILSAATYGFYRTVVYLGHYYNDEEIEDICSYFDSLGYGCYINGNILTVVW